MSSFVRKLLGFFVVAATFTVCVVGGTAYYMHNAFIEQGSLEHKTLFTV